MALNLMFFSQKKFLRSMKNLRKMLSLSMQLAEVTEFVNVFWKSVSFWTNTYLYQKNVKKNISGTSFAMKWNHAEVSHCPSAPPRSILFQENFAPQAHGSGFSSKVLENFHYFGVVFSRYQFSLFQWPPQSRVMLVVVLLLSQTFGRRSSLLCEACER